MMNENDEILFSQLVDGELSSDRTNDLLLEVLDDADGRQKLKKMLQLRRSTSAWRNSKPQVAVTAVVESRRLGRSSTIRHFGGWAIAACIGGILVLAGFWAAGRLGQPANQVQKSEKQYAQTVTPDQMQQAAKVFALHESVAGPLAWYADDDTNIRLASAGEGEAGRLPIAILLKLQGKSPADPPRTLLVVCRDKESAVIELPAESPDKDGLKLYLAPRSVNGKVDMNYTIAVAGEDSGPAVASVSGQRRVGLSETSLGQLAFGDKTLNIEAAAWPLPQERK